MKMINFLFLSVNLLFVPASYAYIGPGAGLGAIAITIALLIGVLLLLLGIVWFPLKRFLKSRSKAEDTSTQSDDNK